MGFYSRFILPTIIDVVMDDKQAAEYRARVVPEATDRVLEIGMGSGHNLPFYGDGVTSVVGLEPSAELMAMAQKRAADKALDIEFVGQPAEAMPFENASFDTVLTTWTLCSIDGYDAVLAEMRRVLKPAGRIGTRLIEARVHALLVLFDDQLVLDGGDVPQPFHAVDVVVLTFLRIVAHQPNDLAVGGLHVDGCEAVDHPVVAVEQEVA